MAKERKERITISVTDDQLRVMTRLAGDAGDVSVSAWVTRLVARTVADDQAKPYDQSSNRLPRSGETVIPGPNSAFAKKE